eukprot:jgi/Mesvir1/5156/Mv15298-RA.1
MAEASLDAVVKDVSECKGEAATAQSVPSSGTPVAISPHALIAKGEAPIKRQFLKSIDRNSGVNNDKPADNARPSGARLSKNAAKRQKYEQRHQSRLTELCSAVSKGGSVACCSFGDRCRFNHDIQAYLKQKPEDLPGVCPFTHSPPGQEGSLRSQGGSQGGAVQAQSSSHANGGAAPATTAPEQADGGDVPPGNPGPQEGTAAQGKASPVDDVSKAGGGVAGAGVAGSLPITGAPVAGAVCPHNLSCRYMGTHPPQPEGSRVAARADEEGGEGRSLGASREFRDQDGEANFLRKEVKDTLWKGRASFPRADPLLIAAGVKVRGAKRDKGPQQPQQGKGKGGGGQGQGQGQSGKDIHDGVMVADAEPWDGQDGEGDGADPVDGPEVVTNEEMANGEQGEAPGAAGGGRKRARDGDGGAEDDQEAEETDSAIASGMPEQGQGQAGAVSKEEGFATQGGAGVASSEEILLGCVKHPLAGRAATADITNNSSLFDERHLVGDDEELPLGLRERKLVDFRGKLYLAPLTTVGNLPFRRVCKALGADITCGEMALATNLLQGQASEWALLRRHVSEDIFGVQLCGGYPDAVARAAEIVEKECAVDFVDVNMGCPIDLICNKGAGSALLLKSQRIENIVRITSRVLTCPLTVKLRTGYYDRENTAHKLLPHMREWGAAAVTLHGRSRQQRYSRAADWEYIGSCASACPSLPIIGNGDVYAFTDYYEHMERSPLATCMIARGALYKPWIFTEIKERRHWDISSGERMELLKKFVWFGLQHWGCDSRGVENTRRFLLEWLSYLHRYIPVGLLEVIPQRMHWRAPAFYGRDELETLFASGSPSDWIKISEMLLGRAPPGFTFTPKHSSDAYDNKGEMQNG